MVSASLPPVARVVPSERNTHGRSFTDNYEWLRDKDDPATIAYLDAENAYTQAQTGHLETLRDTIFAEIKSRTQETDLSVPVREGNWWYYARTTEGQQYAMHCRAAVSGPDDWSPPNPDTGAPIPGEQVLLDTNVEAEGHDFFSLGSLDVTDDGSLLLYTTDTVGDERYVLHVRDVNTGEELSDTAARKVHSAMFAPDGRSIFYTTVDEAWRPDSVWRHDLGSPSDTDALVFHESDERYWVGMGLTRSRRFIEIGVGSKITSESLLIDAATPREQPRVVWPRREGVEYGVDHAVVNGEDRLLILHNDGAKNFELVSVAAAEPGSGPLDATVLIPHNDDIRLEDVSAFAHFVTAEYRRDGLTCVAVGHFHGDDLDLEELSFDEPLYTVGTGGNPEWIQPTVRLGYGSLITPATVYDYDVATKEMRVLKRQPVLGNYNPADYREQREWAHAEDGTRIPISLVWKSNLPRTGTGPADATEPSTGDVANTPAVHASPPAADDRPREARPLLLYGYGSYEASMDPALSISRLSLLDRGVVFAIAHVRGGGEMGRSWYEDGKLLAKKNTFTDFVACANHLVSTGWTHTDQLVAEGGSAGGLLMGAVANMAPEHFAGIVASVPFVDPLTSMLDATLPLTVIEWDEWGNPLDDAAVYDYMRNYSPYENVRDDVRYPRILAVTSLNDTRVMYVEPAKWVAKLRTVEAPVLLKTEMSAGHGGVSGRYAGWKERAFELAWILDVLGAANASQGGKK